MEAINPPDGVLALAFVSGNSSSRAGNSTRVQLSPGSMQRGNGGALVGSLFHMDTPQRLKKKRKRKKDNLDASIHPSIHPPGSDGWMKLAKSERASERLPSSTCNLDYITASIVPRPSITIMSIQSLELAELWAATCVTRWIRTNSV